MLRLKPGSRRVLVERLPELANFLVGSLVFGQLLLERPFSLAMATVGLTLWGGLMVYACHLADREDNR